MNANGFAHTTVRECEALDLPNSVLPSHFYCRMFPHLSLETIYSHHM